MKIALDNSGKNQPSGSAFHQYLATFTGTLAIICTGMHFGWPSPSLPQLLHEQSEIPMTSADGSWMAVMPCLGAAVGSFTGAFIVDKIGRKMSMLTVSPLYFISWLMVAFSQTVWMLNTARFLAGIADGIAFTAFPIYVGEISDCNIRGFLGSSIPVTTMLGLLLINAIGSYFSITVTALISSLVPLLHFVTFCFMPESPYYLLMKEKRDEAHKTLQKLRGTENVDLEIMRLSESVAEESKEVGSIWDLFTIKSNRKAVFIIMGIRTVQQFSGVNAIAFYANMIFEEGGSSISSSSASIIYFFLQLVTAIVSSILVDKAGRRPLLIISIIGSGLALAAEGVYFYLKTHTNADISSLSFLPLTSLLVFVVVFNIGLGTIPVMMLGELFPTSVKAFALCLADIYFGVIVTIVSKFFQIVKDDFGMSVPFFVFTASCALGLIFIVASVPETKGKTLEEIQQYLKGEKVEPVKNGEIVERF